MTIKEVIKELRKQAKFVGENSQVVLSSDSEGNSYSTLDVRSFWPCYEEETREVIGLVIIPFEEGFQEAEEAIKTGEQTYGKK